MIASSREFTRGLVVYNPTKTATPKFRKMQEKIRHLSSTHNLPLTPVDTHKDSRPTQDKILQTMRDRDLLIILGGDGTVNVAVSALLRVERAKRPTIVAAPMGTANDFSRNHSGRLRGVHGLTHLLRAGKQIDIHPMVVSVENTQASTQDEYIGVNNAGFHYTGSFSRRLNSPGHRDSRLRRVPLVGQLAQELRSVHNSTAELTTFTSHEDGGDESQQLVDRTLVHARTVGKYGHFAISHVDNEFLDIPNSEATRSAIIKSAARMALGLEPGIRRTNITFMTGMEPTVGHVDGEPFDIDPYSFVEAHLSDEAFSAYSLQK